MSSLASVRTAWAAVLANSTITGYTNRLYDYDIVSTEAVSQVGHDANFMQAGYVNFAQFVFSKTHNFEMTCQVRETFNVDISYYYQVDIDGDTFKSCTDFFDDLFTVVRSELGTSWDSTIEFYTMEDVAVNPGLLTDKQVWIATQRYIGKNVRSL